MAICMHVQSSLERLRTEANDQTQTEFRLTLTQSCGHPQLLARVMYVKYLYQPQSQPIKL